ncbi:MAG: GNAT family N-acetyltransferase, partial [Ekhidna sp.]
TDFLEECGNATYCHLYEWKYVFEKAYGLNTHYLSLSENDELVAVLPLAELPRFPFSVRRAISLPYNIYGGPICRNPETKVEHLTQFTAELASLGINLIEIRTAGDSQVISDEVAMILNLPSTLEDLWRSIGPKVRNLIRKSEKYEFVAHWGHDGLPDFYNVYSTNIGRLGTPVHSMGYFSEILSNLGDRAMILTLSIKSQAIASMFVIRFKNSYAVPFASSLAEFNKYNPNMFMYWEALKMACSEGASYFDFGRSNINSGTCRFKKQWGSHSVSLDYFSMKNCSRVDESSVHHYRGRKANMISYIWSNLPYGIQKKIGPLLRKRIP